MPPRRRPTTSGQVAPSPVLQPQQYLQPFLHYLQAECGMSMNTVSAYRVDLNQFIEWANSVHIVSVLDVNLQVLSGFVESLHNRDLKATTIARRLVALKMFFRYLVLEGVVAESTVELLSSPKLWRYLPTVLSPEMVDRLLESPGWADQFPLRDRAVLALLYATGCRASEIAGMRVTDVKLEQNFCRCLGKGNKERIVSLNPIAEKAIRNYLTRERPHQVRLHDSEALFVTRTGRPLSRINIWQLVKKYSVRSGCGGKVSPHTLRHSFATHMLAGGAEIRALQEMLGHASIRTTQIYTQVEHSRLKAIHSKCHPRG
ncbi:site-specific tyrosine recombinase XerD [Planctomicrobium sp. SH527]|uniref:site-specific tyrosine recombinase XerD n=1 Tax=Planctomicrobium sp. SH527 TaxID=3448123 RepID=UPI003F5C62AF